MTEETIFDIKTIKRFEVIDHRTNIKQKGRVYVVDNIEIRFFVQDNKTTLKAVITNKKRKKGNVRNKKTKT